jgi:hypothetical protein
VKAILAEPLPGVETKLLGAPNTHEEAFVEGFGSPVPAKSAIPQ